MRLAAVVVAYHPERDILTRNIRAFAACVDAIVIWRNSEFDESWVSEWSDKVTLMGDGSNKLMAYPLNQTLRWCRSHGYDYLLTMDQDSEWLDFEGFIKTVMRHLSPGIALYAPLVNHSFPDKAEECEVVESVITSGVVCDVNTAISLGGFREDYGIYWVDGEYCRRAVAKGYRTVVFPAYRMLQRFGRETEVFGRTTANYSASSYYYLFRNMLWMHREYGDNPGLRCVAYTSYVNLRGIILGERHKGVKLRAIARALFEGLFSRVSPRLM